jgi:phytoene dehydrogenase-like protein
VADGSVIVIGGGIAGLASGIYAQANGFDATVLEMHTLPGGLCTSWGRQGYCFDGCIHWFVGGKSDAPFHALWEEVGATDGLELIAHDRLSSIRDSEGNELVLWADLERLASSMREKWPEEGAGIKELVDGSRAMVKAGSVLPDVPPDMMGPMDGLKMLLKAGSTLSKMRKYQSTSMREIGGLFADPFLQRAVRLAVTEPRMSALAVLSTLGWFDEGDANWVAGGSLGLARKLEKRLLDLGGTISYRAKVETILVEDDRAVGVRLSDGTELRADHVIGAADGHAEIFDMLGGRYADAHIRELYDTLEPFPPIIQVSLGVDRDLSGEPWSVVQLLDEGTEIGGSRVEAIWSHHYSYDPSMAPAGKSAITTIFGADLAHWESLKAQGREVYDSAKDDVARQVIDLVDRAYPGIRDKVEVIDVATPTTYIRYTGNWKASFEGWLLSPENSKAAGMAGLPRKLTGLGNFVMAGQWVWPGGGLPSGVLTGRWAVQTICADVGKRFVAPRSAKRDRSGT